MTCHSLSRAKERVGLSQSAAIKFIDNAKINGKTPEEFPAKERKYMQNLEKGGSVIYFAEYIFILSEDDRCITLYRVPGWFGKKNNFRGKEVIRNRHRYFRMNRCCNT